MQELIETSSIRAARRLGSIFRDIAVGSDIGAKARIAVIGSRTGEHRRQAIKTSHQARGCDRVSAVVLQSKSNSRLTSRRAAVHLQNVDVETRQSRRVSGYGVGAFDGCVKFQLALRRVAVSALVVVDL